MCVRDLWIRVLEEGERHPFLPGDQGYRFGTRIHLPHSVVASLPQCERGLPAHTREGAACYIAKADGE